MMGIDQWSNQLSFFVPFHNIPSGTRTIELRNLYRLCLYLQEANLCLTGQGPENMLQFMNIRCVGALLLTVTSTVAVFSEYGQIITVSIVEEL